ncbi:MAG TPA: ATP-dependent Clp protease ATP-binding subunit ClpX, partial [Leptospiraceae bacterium]|nr:ATP-dependent Clp protease ATP-binding subunit ClpX [Leptospiraceae bacterium]
GLIPEFVGRIPVIATLDDLDVDTLKQIFAEPKNSILKQYQKMFEMENVKLRFTDEAITRIADEAIKREAGARGLRSIVEKIMMDLMYDIPGNEDIDQVVITPQVIESGDQPVVTYKKDEKKKEKDKEKKEKFA